MAWRALAPGVTDWRERLSKWVSRAGDFGQDQRGTTNMPSMEKPLRILRQGLAGDEVP
jgi:hypothetical protein